MIYFMPLIFILKNMKKLLMLFIALTSLSFGLYAQSYNVTFSVDMNEVDASFTTPEVNGSWDGWCGGCTPLSDPDGDGVWTTTKTLEAGYYEYKFAYDAWSGDESLTPGSSCTVTAFGFTNRFITVSEDVVLDEVCYAACTTCAEAVTVAVTLSVNMNDVAAPFTTPEVNGSWDGWCGGCTPLSDPDGDGVWKATKMLPPGYYEYKFAYDSWSGDESLTEGDPCTVTTDGFTNRFIEATEDVVLETVCWATCEICPGIELEQMDLPVTFDEPGVDYGVIGFEGAEASFIVADPTDPSNTVVQATKSATAAFYAGTTVTNAAEEGFATQIPFTEDETSMSVRVWSPHAPINIKLKVEDFSDPTKSVETETMLMVAEEWTTLIFDFSNESTLTAPLDLSYYYNKASIFFNFGVDGATAGEQTYYFDDLEFYTGGGSDLLQMDLPVTFEDPMVEYGLIGFAGAEASTIVTDPTDPANTVAQVVRSSSAAVFAGTVITNPAGDGLANPIPFTADDTKMSLRVWSPEAGIVVRLKVEDYLVGSISVETDQLTTVAGEWETLIFDFSDEVPFTPALDLDANYNKPVVFFNFGVEGAVAGEATYYFDDLEFYLGEPVCDIPSDFEVTDITSSGASFNWSDVALSDQYVVTIFNAASGASRKFRPTESSLTISDALAPSTEYGARVKTVCYDEGLRSENTETIFFTTAPLRLAGDATVTTVYPNPTSGNITIQSSGYQGAAMLTVVSLSGQMMYQQQISDAISTLDLSHLANGLYMITIADEEKVETFNISLAK